MIRNVRNNNPGNIRVGGHWQGLAIRINMTPFQEAESSFCVFEDPRWGFRALGIILRTYGHDGIETLHDCIERWAPPGDHNNTAAYVEDVAAKSGVADIPGARPGSYNPWAKIDLEDQPTVLKIAKAIASHETAGTLPYDKSFDLYWKEADLEAGIAAAFGKPFVQ